MTTYRWNDQDVTLISLDDYEIDAVIETADGRQWEIHRDSLEIVDDETND